MVARDHGQFVLFNLGGVEVTDIEECAAIICTSTRRETSGVLQEYSQPALTSPVML